MWPLRGSLEPAHELEEWRRRLRTGDAAERADAADQPPRGHADQITAALVEALADPDATVRLCAAESLGDHGTSAAAEPLAERLSAEPDPLARAFSASSLGRVGAAEHVHALEQCLATGDTPHEQIHATMGHLTLIRRLARDRLIHFLAHPDDAVCLAAAEALVALLVDVDDEPVRTALQAAATGSDVRDGALAGLLDGVWGGAESDETA